MGTRLLRLIPVALTGVAAVVVAYVASPTTFASITSKLGDLRFTNQTSSYRLTPGV